MRTYVRNACAYKKPRWVGTGEKKKEKEEMKIELCGAVELRPNCFGT